MLDNFIHIYFKHFFSFFPSPTGIPAAFVVVPHSSIFSSVVYIYIIMFIYIYIMFLFFVFHVAYLYCHISKLTNYFLAIVHFPTSILIAFSFVTLKKALPFPFNSFSKFPSLCLHPPYIFVCCPFH